MTKWKWFLKPAVLRMTSIVIMRTTLIWSLADHMSLVNDGATTDLSIDYEWWLQEETPQQYSPYEHAIRIRERMHPNPNYIPAPYEDDYDNMDNINSISPRVDASSDDEDDLDAEDDGSILDHLYAQYYDF